MGVLRNRSVILILFLRHLRASSGCCDQSRRANSGVSLEVIPHNRGFNLGQQKSFEVIRTPIHFHLLPSFGAFCVVLHEMSGGCQCQA